MKRSLAAAWIMAVSLFWGIAPVYAAGQERIRTEEARGIAHQLVGKLFATYQNYNRLEFENLLADDFRPIRVKFMADLEDRAYRAKVLEMHYVLDKVLTSGSRLVAVFSWEKKSVPVGASGPVLVRGKAKAVFSLDQGAWKLLSMGGSSPF